MCWKLLHLSWLLLLQLPAPSYSGLLELEPELEPELVLGLELGLSFQAEQLMPAAPVGSDQTV
jgi:hypothetical protein